MTTSLNIEASAHHKSFDEDWTVVVWGSGVKLAEFSYSRYDTADQVERYALAAFAERLHDALETARVETEAELAASSTSPADVDLGDDGPDDV